ncbi:hypothetical protein RR45_GL000056 [Lactococcus chungangensis CAU 28 = DSM 22330]|uniref:Uncharacterized protein n=1 Tax=Pseudolactococcus chungangensis CAU 28 = DSM 22330 TaxID=1122154 RepID=A0ABX4IB82_9LACT|nr:hypothetical protein RR45_GL000055 [Lactococcus chungangensis CAU 28 = DSM 22330]PCS04737.1 hypothetical protein RR45_GL000056 [Lactococcus chungangensis CAU 28 = DSM 22330]
MTLLGGSASGCQVSRFHKVKTQKAFERPKFANDPAWRERKRMSSFKVS